jgi:hypothetical protein
MNPKITLVPLLLFQPTLDNKKDGNKCKDVLKKEAIAPLTLNKTPRKCVAVSTAQYVYSLSDVLALFCRFATGVLHLWSCAEAG